MVLEKKCGHISLETGLSSTASSPCYLMVFYLRVVSWSRRKHIQALPSRIWLLLHSELMRGNIHKAHWAFWLCLGEPYMMSLHMESSCGGSSTNWYSSFRRKSVLSSWRNIKRRLSTSWIATSVSHGLVERTGLLRATLVTGSVEEHFAVVDGSGGKPLLLQRFSTLDHPLPFVGEFFWTYPSVTQQLLASEEERNLLSNGKRVAYKEMGPLHMHGPGCVNFSLLSVGDVHTTFELSTTPALDQISLEYDVFTDNDHTLLRNWMRNHSPMGECLGFPMLKNEFRKTSPVD